MVGDTPHDIECANAIGVKTIAVATGGYTLDELAAHRPWQAFETLPSPEAFVRLLDPLAEPSSMSGHASGSSRGPA